jgi:hypothetical protein
MAVYVLWNIWKERGRRIFQNEVLPASGVAKLIRAELELLRLARANVI